MSSSRIGTEARAVERLSLWTTLGVIRELVVTRWYRLTIPASSLQGPSADKQPRIWINSDAMSWRPDSLVMLRSSATFCAISLGKVTRTMGRPISSLLS